MDDGRTTDGQRMDDGACLYYKLTNEPKGSGELKNHLLEKITERTVTIIHWHVNLDSNSTIVIFSLQVRVIALGNVFNNEKQKKTVRHLRKVTSFANLDIKIYKTI